MRHGNVSPASALDMSEPDLSQSVFRRFPTNRLALATHKRFGVAKQVFQTQKACPRKSQLKSLTGSWPLSPHTVMGSELTPFAAASVPAFPNAHCSDACRC
jgi:hypothetical protein